MPNAWHPRPRIELRDASDALRRSSLGNDRSPALGRRNSRFAPSNAPSRSRDRGSLRRVLAPAIPRATQRISRQTNVLGRITWDPIDSWRQYPFDLVVMLAHVHYFD